MEISDEARERVGSLYASVTDVPLRETLRSTALDGAEVAAPIIARSAQVAVLRKWSAKLDKFATYVEFAGFVADDMRAEIAKLEAGA